MPEGTLQLEHLMQATKLLQLKKASLADIEIIFDVCWMLTPTQIQKLVANCEQSALPRRQTSYTDSGGTGRLCRGLREPHLSGDPARRQLPRCRWRQE